MSFTPIPLVPGAAGNFGELAKTGGPDAGAYPLNHGTALVRARDTGDAHAIATCLRFIQAGDRCPLASFYLCKSSWASHALPYLESLMHAYIGAGQIQLDVMHSGDGKPMQRPPLQTAMHSKNASAVAVLLEAGALEVTNFVSAVNGQPFPVTSYERRLAVFEFFAQRNFAGQPEQLARFTEILMHRRLSAELGTTPPWVLSPPTEAPTPSPAARPRRTL
ncbi:hypothetical protein ABIC83_002796 [Roseateles asaccharophilus]|uniref:hypothetical protein n=1 Tax=Roseateles asaccharophilus TaxID=582607 RepID=UPI0038384813